MDDNTSKWTEIEHLPEWDEEFYHVYTAKKHGKWLMLKTLRPELKGIPEYEEMINKEFEVRYNLAHPHIIMINDLEEVPGLGLCIITDDVYGDSLAKLIREGKVTSEHIYKLHHQLLDALGVDGSFCHSIASFRFAGCMRAIISSHRRVAHSRMQPSAVWMRQRLSRIVPAIISRCARVWICPSRLCCTLASCRISSLVSYS